MNKLTLSAAALTAIVAPAQMQAADLSPDDKASEIKRVRKDLTDAINEIGKMNMAVQKIHLVFLSGISAEIDSYDDANKVLTETTVADWEDRINRTKETAKLDQMPYDSKANLDNAIAEFQKKYTDAVKNVKGYAYAGDAAKRTLDGYKATVDGIKTKVDGFDLTKTDILSQEPILMRQITDQTTAIDDLLAGIQAKDDAIANTNDAAVIQKDFKVVYDAAKTAYMEQRKAVVETLKVYPYQDWIEAANAQLNGQSRLLDELKAADDAQFEAVKADPTDENKTKYVTNCLERKTKAENAQKVIEGVLGSYKEGVEIQDGAKEKADSDIAELESKLTDIKTKLDDRKITDCSEAITNVETLIEKKKEEVKGKYELHEIYGANLNLSAIKTPLDKIIKKGEGLVDNHDAYSNMITEIETAKRNLENAVSAAKEASKDKYAVTDNFDVKKKRIAGDIENLEIAVTTAYNDKKAADYERYNFNIDPINGDIADYTANTTAALAAYDKAQAYITKAKDDCGVLVGTAEKDLTVTVAGTDETYGQKIKKINDEISEIENAVADALKITDNADNHKNAIEKASEMTVSEDILGLKNAYSNNKDHHDNQLTINAAQNVLDAANGKIEDIEKVIESITGDFGFQKDDIENKKTALEGNLDGCKGTLNNEDVVAFTKEGATFEEKADVAQKVIAALSTVVNDLEGENGEGGIKKEVNDLKAEADAAVANTKAYKDVVETLIPTKINTAIKAFKDKIASVYPEPKEAGDEAKLFFEGELARLKKAVDDAASGMETAYRDKKAVAKKDEIEPILEDYKKEANTLKDKIYLNKTQHNSQVTAAEALMTLYNQKYDYILNNDKSDAAAGYLQKLNEEKVCIETLKNTTIPEAYKKGNSNTNPDKKKIEDEIERIKTEINDIANASKADYDKNVNTANQLQRDNFEKAYKAANEAFNNAVTTLNDFSNIQNDAIKTALVSLIETHDKIYAYADSLRNLKAQEAGDWDKYWEKYKTEESLEYGADIYNAQAVVDTAVKYMNDIRKLKLDYQNNVNKEALDLYQSKVDNAQGMIDHRKDQIKDFIYDGKKNAFQEADEILAAVKEACALDPDGTVHDKDFAVNIDRNDWLAKLDDIYGKGNGLLDELLAACKAEKKKRVGDVTSLYTSEHNMIVSHDELKDYNGRNLIAELENLKVTTIDKATGATVNLYNVKYTIIPKCAEYAQYALTDGKYVLGHSSIYDDAVAALGDIQANDDAYGIMFEGIGLLESDFNEVKEIVEKLIVGHQDGDTYSALISIEDDLENAKIGLEGTRENLGCVNYMNKRFDSFVNGIKDQLVSLKTTAVSEEIEQLKEKLKEVKEEYNQAAKENLDQVKEYDAQIDDLYNALKGIQDKFDNMDPNTAFEGAVNKLAGQETEIARVNGELNAMYENQQTADAVKAIGDKLTEVNDDIAEVMRLAEYNEGEHDNVIQDTYLEQAQALRGEYGFINEDYENKNAAGQILFFQKNILHDLDVLLADTQKFCVDLKAMYDKHKENNDVYSTLNAELAAAKEALALAYDRIDALENKQPATTSDSKTLIEEKKKKFESNFETLQENLDEMREGVNLTKTESINSDINGFNGTSGKIYELERDAKYYDAKERLVSLEDDILESLNNIDVQKNEGRKYDIGRETALRDEYNAIQALCGYAKSYNNDAFDNYVRKDIDNNPVYHWENGIRYDGDEIDYNTTAWDTIDERINTLTKRAKQFAADVEGWSFRQGDVDQNNKVNVNDYSEVRNIILNAQSYEDVKAEAEGRALAADCNEDKDINVADLTGVSNILLHGKWDWSPASNGAKKTRAKVSAEDEINISNEGEETTIFGKTVRMAVNLAHSEAFTSGQMDITMPQGMKIVGQSMSDRANGHDIFANDLGNGVTRLLTATIDNNEFNGRNGALIYLDVEVSSDFSGGQISIDNIIFSDAAGRMYTMSSIGGNGDGATGIDGIKAATVKERIYSVGGQMMKAVKKGINIIVGEDGKARKIVNK